MRLLLLGDGPAAERWACALASVAQVWRSVPELPGDLEAVVLAPGTFDPFSRAQEALRAGLPVLYAAPFLLTPWQTAILRDEAAADGLLLRFAEPFRHRPGFAFLRRVFAGSEPFWRPLYLRALRLGRREDGARLDELATEELACCQALLEAEPEAVSATAAQRDATGDVCAAFLTVRYRGGAVVQITVSLAEVMPGRQLVAATGGRTLVLDELGPVASLCMTGADGEELLAREGSGGKLVSAPARDAVAGEAAYFGRAVRERDLSAGNGRAWTRVAAAWWAARQSIAFGAPAELPEPARRAADAEPPPLRVIKGGGLTVRAARKRPPLTVVRG
jgi:predicted dehydrogenase